MALKLVRDVKGKLSHVKTTSWHWRATSFLWGKNAKGKACVYYWWKLPTALLILGVFSIIGLIIITVRLVLLLITWLLGFRYTGSIIDIEEPIFNSHYYAQTPEGMVKRAKVAPLMILLIPVTAWLAWQLIFVNPYLGILVLKSLLALVGAVILVYFITGWWKNPIIKRARAAVKNAWDDVCPVLEVEDIQTR